MTKDLKELEDLLDLPPKARKVRATKPPHPYDNGKEYQWFWQFKKDSGWTPRGASMPMTYKVFVAWLCEAYNVDEDAIEYIRPRLKGDPGMYYVGRLTGREQT